MNSKGTEIINQIKDVLLQHRPDLYRLIQQEEIKLLTWRQIEMIDPDKFETLVTDYVQKNELKWKTAYSLVESEHFRAFGKRKYSGYKSFMNAKNRE